VEPRVELAGEVPEKFREDMARATLRLNIDGEDVLQDALALQFLGDLSAHPGKSPFVFRGEKGCLFTAHRMTEDKQMEPRPDGFFLPQGSQIKATIKGAPPIPQGVEVRIGGLGSHYAPGFTDAGGCPLSTDRQPEARESAKR
jgi:hypothetical protein